MSDQGRFPDRLIGAEQVDAKRKEHYRMEMQRILNRTLTPGRRIWCAFTAAVSLLAAANFGVMAFTQHITGDYALWGRAIYGAFAVLLLALAAVVGRMAMKGTANLRKDLPAIAGLRWGLSFLLSISALLAAWLDARYGSGKWSAFAAAVGVAFIVFGAIHLIRSSVQQSELRTREKMLEIELRLADMADKLGEEPG